MRVLVVDDEVDLAVAVGRGLRREGYAVDVVHSGEEALDRLAYTSYDLVCLDLTMPGIDGLEVCRTIRREYGPEPRVLMLTARDAVADRVAGLDEGADDYLVKPFALPELLGPGPPAAAPRQRPARRHRCGWGRCSLDTARHEAWRGERRLELTAKEFALLRYFMTHPGEVLSQERLLEHVWDENADPFTNTVRVTVGTLAAEADDRRRGTGARDRRRLRLPPPGRRVTRRSDVAADVAVGHVASDPEGAVAVAREREAPRMRRAPRVCRRGSARSRSAWRSCTPWSSSAWPRCSWPACTSACRGPSPISR